ncbi:MAG: hypothetical protein KBT03_04140 [Bacteroidales bacterium]|nr:hypothetical protein [Candidatus Scybalousia scybalohippi]
MEYYNHNNESILIGHFPGKSRIESADILEKYKKTKFMKPFGVQFISIITPDYLKNGACLDFQLKRNGIEYLNPAKYDYFGKWSMPKKIKYIIKALKQTKEPYALILDGADVCIMNEDLTSMIEKFKSYNKKIIFNATIWAYPKTNIDIIENREQYGRFCHLNAGCCIGETKALLEFYEECQQLVNNDKIGSNSEQYYIRQVFNNHQDTVFFDYDCKIFQIWHKPIYEERCLLF